jgi:hypothetical protein
VTLVEFQELQGELTYRIELNSILKLGNDQLREKCDELADQVASLLKKNETLSHELERSRHLVATTKKQRLHARDAKPELLSKLKNQDEAVVVSAVVKQQDGAIEVLRQENLVLTHLVSELEVELDEVRQVSEHAMSKAAEHTSARPVSAARRLPGGDAGDCLVLMGTNGGGSDTWVLDEGIITIGSSANSDIPIESRYVSQHHAQLIRTQQGAVLEDLNSTNGTYINARRIKKRAIRAGDLITIGKTRFRYGKRPAERANGETNNFESRLHSELT